jgi:hypothetical protein
MDDSSVISLTQEKEIQRWPSAAAREQQPASKK